MKRSDYGSVFRTPNSVFRSLFPVFCLLFVGCARVSPDDFSISSIEVERLELPSSLTLGLDVESRSRHRVELLECRLEVEYRGDRLMTLLLSEPVELPPHFAGRVEVPLRFRLSDPLAMLALPAGSPEKMLAAASVSGEAQLKIGGMKRRIRLKEYPLEQLINHLSL